MVPVILRVPAFAVYTVAGPSQPEKLPDSFDVELPDVPEMLPNRAVNSVLGL
jgi:hypothetical protein